jgi:hypothetical protein
MRAFPRKAFTLFLGILTGRALLYFLLFMVFLAVQSSLQGQLPPSLSQPITTLLELQYSVLLVPVLVIYYMAHLYGSPATPRRLN